MKRIILFLLSLMLMLPCWSCAEESAPTLSGLSAEEMIPFSYVKTCRNGGNIEAFTYTAHDLFHENEPYEKTAFVYLPRGYDPAQTYDLLIAVMES